MNILSFLVISLGVLLVVALSGAAGIVVNASAAPPDPNICPFCEFGAALIQGYLADNATVTEIELAFDAICDVAPGPVKTTCQDFALNSLPILLQDLSAGKSAEQACADIGACAASALAAPDAPRRMMRRRTTARVN